MSVRVRIPSPLQSLTDNQPEVAADGSTLAELLANLDAKFSGIGKRLYDDEGKLRRFVNVYVNDEDIRFLQGEDTPLREGDEVSIVPAIAGGLTDVAEGAA
ncbi:MAG: MoaD/ThiS family protein [Armatimonadota bacterium]